MAMMGHGAGYGDSRAIDAATNAISSPLLEDVSIHGARGVLVNITASEDFGIQELNEAVDAHPERRPTRTPTSSSASVHDPNLDDEVRITVIATGFGDQMSERPAGRADAATTTAYHHPHPAREAAAPELRATPQQAALRLPLIDDRVEDTPLHRPHHDATPERHASSEDWAIPADAPEAEHGESINIPAYIRRWRGKRRGAPA